MQSKTFKEPQSQATAGFDLVRLCKSKVSVDISPNTMRAYHRAGLPFYRLGKAIFFSKFELAAFIRTRGVRQHQFGSNGGATK